MYLPKCVLIESDAAIQPGDSGGALVDSSAKVVGVVTAGAFGAASSDLGSATNGYAIPIDQPRTIAQQIYRARDVSADKSVRDQLAAFEAMGYGKCPVCIAKTQYSFSTNPDAKGAPVDHVINVREVRLSAGAEFVVAVCGEIMTMPGLPKVPAADSIDVGADGKIVGLF